MQLYLVPSEDGAWFKKNHPWKISFWLTDCYQKERIMLLGPLARRWCKIPKTFLREAPDFDKGQVCWPHVTLYSSLCVTKIYKQTWKLRKRISFWKDWFPCIVLSCSPFFWLNSHLERGCSPSLLILPWLLRSTGEGAQGGAPSAIQVGTGGLRRWCKLLVLKLYWYPT